MFAGAQSMSFQSHKPEYTKIVYSTSQAILIALVDEKYLILNKKMHNASLINVL